jgi:hypothetical protein
MSASILDPRMIDLSKPLQISETNITSLTASFVQVSALSLSAITFTNRFTVATTLTATTTVLEVQVNGTSKYLPLFDIN